MIFNLISIFRNIFCHADNIIRATGYWGEIKLYISKIIFIYTRTKLRMKVLYKDKNILTNKISTRIETKSCFSNCNKKKTIDIFRFKFYVFFLIIRNLISIPFVF